MVVKQTKDFDQSKGGSKPGYCLRNVRQGFGIWPWYADATSAWNHTEQHTTPIPSGVDVPLFFYYVNPKNNKNEGHIGVQLKDGRFWSDGTIYSNYKSYEANHAPDYLGWGESINKQRVLELEEEDEVSTPTKETLRIIHGFVAGWDIEKCLAGKYDKEFEQAAGWKEVNEFIYEQFIKSSEWKNKLIALQKGTQPTVLKKGIYEVK